ncbi:hypothetical protein L6R29_11055 [Myxococcota bacterium]|nr:hypothetical protein [Myxococcota bacterium]
MKKRSLSLFLFFFVQLSVFSAYAADPEAPYNKHYLLNPQDHLYTVNVDPLNPPNSLASLTEILLTLSEGGVIVHWDREQDRPADITVEIPLNTENPLNGLLSFLHSVKTIYGINNVTEDLELQSHNTNVARGDSAILPDVDVIVLKQVCRFNENQIIEVDGGRIIATLRSSDKRLTRLVSTFHTLECISPTNLLTESQIAALHGTPNSEIILKLAPPRPELGHSTPLYVYQFIDSNNQFLEVKATNGEILRTHNTTMNAFGLERSISERSWPGGLKCRDSDVEGQYNSPSRGSLCTNDYLEVYNSLYYAILPMKGKHHLTQALGNGQNVGWGSAINFQIIFNYNTEGEQSGPEHFGSYGGTQINVSKFAYDSSNDFRTLQTYQNNPLPGLGGVVDLVGHEVGHGYIASFIQTKGLPTGTNTFVSPSANYQIGRAITEGFADIYGQLSEVRARYVHAACAGNYDPSCGDHELQSCGSTVCERGEYCASNNHCVACNEECGADQTQIARATLDPKFVHTYHKTGYPVLEDNKSIRDLGPNPHGADIISCNQHEIVQYYHNSLFLSRMALSYHTAPDRLRNINGYIRHVGDVSVGEDFFKQTLLNIRGGSTGPSRRDAEIAWLGSAGSLIKDTPSAVWNARKWDIVTLRGLGIILKMLTPVQGKCTNGCIAGSKYECLRPHP